MEFIVLRPVHVICTLARERLVEIHHNILVSRQSVDAPKHLLLSSYGGLTKCQKRRSSLALPTTSIVTLPTLPSNPIHLSLLSTQRTLETLANSCPLPPQKSGTHPPPLPFGIENSNLTLSIAFNGLRSYFANLPNAGGGTQNA